MSDIYPRFFTQVPSYLNGYGLNSTDKLIYGIIYTIINTNGQCFKSNSKIAEETEVAKKSVANALTKLKQKGFIKTERTYKDGTKEVDKRFIKLSDDFKFTKGIPYSQIREYPILNEGKPIPLKGKESKSFSKSFSSSSSETSENPYELYQQMTGLTLNGWQQPKMINLIKTDGTELVISALKKAQYIAKQSDSKPSYNLFERVIREWEDKGVKTVDQAREYEKQRLHDKQARINKSKQAYYGHQIIDKKIPESMKEQYDPEKDKVSDKDKQDVERLLDEFDERRKEENE